MSDTVILTKNDGSDSKITMHTPKDSQSMTV
jgi:hypothetical protein